MQLRWTDFINGIREEGYDGTGEDLAEVKAWMKVKGHEPELITSSGVVRSLREKAGVVADVVEAMLEDGEPIEDVCRVLMRFDAE